MTKRRYYLTGQKRKNAARRDRPGAGERAKRKGAKQ